MDQMIEGFVKGMLILIFGPILLCLVFQLLVGVFAAIVPWLILVGMVAGLTAGISAALVLRRRLPPRRPPGPDAPYLGSARVRRPRGMDGRNPR